LTKKNGTSVQILTKFRSGWCFPNHFEKYLPLRIQAGRRSPRGGGELNGVGSIAKTTIGIYPKEENRGKSVRNNSSFTFSPGIFTDRLK
jgi:hypothetical protein